MEKNNSVKVYFEASVLGLLRALVGLPFEHPFDSIKSRMQAEISRKTSFLSMAKEIYRTQGIFNGFYAGFIPGAVRNLVKQIYRWPLMLVLPTFYNSVYSPEIKNKYPSIAKISTGLTIAVVDTFVICPFERLKVYLQTKRSDISLKMFFRQNKANLFNSLFRGLSSLFYRQMISWVSFLYTDYKFKDLARAYLRIEKNIPLDGKTLFLTSVTIGITNVFVVMPLDMTKTLYQQHNEEFANKKLTETLKIVYKKTGFKGFYYGWQPRLIQYIIQSFFTVTALEKMEHRIRNSV